MPDECWDNVTELDKLPGFHGVTDAFETFSKDWKDWYLNPEPELQPLVGMYFIPILTACYEPSPIFANSHFEHVSYSYDIIVSSIR